MNRYNDSIKKRLMMLRAEAGESQAYISEVCGVCHASVCRWENGNREIPTHAVIDLCKHYGVSADWVLGLSDKR